MDMALNDPFRTPLSSLLPGRLLGIRLRLSPQRPGMKPRYRVPLTCSTLTSAERETRDSRQIMDLTPMMNLHYSMK